MLKHYKNTTTIVLFTFLSTLLFWFIFWLKLPQYLGFPPTDIYTLFKNYDGPNYLIIAKCGYNPDCIRSNFSMALPLEYYPAHFPGYPVIIMLFDFFLPGPMAMLFTALLGSIFLNLVFYKFLLQKLPAKKALLLTFIFNFLPARLFVLRQIGAPETFFVALLLLSIIHFNNKKYLSSAISLALAQTIKTPAVILLFVYFFIFIKEFFVDKKYLNTINKYLPYCLVPLSVLVIFYVYYLQTGDFWAYFNSGDNHHLFLPPFGVFVSNRSWVYSIWLEDIVYIFLIAYLAIFKLKKTYKSTPTYLFPLFFTMATSFVVHRDISRYLAPVYPFVFVAYNKFLSSKALVKILPILVFITYLYAINFCLGNTAPVADWTPYL